MKSITTSARRVLGSAFAASALGGAVVAVMGLPGAPSADAATDPCAASEVARTIGSVAISTANYLDAHPDTNNVLTSISQSQGGAQGLGTLKNYFDANPQAGKDMQTLQQPLMGLSARCKLPLTLPQVMGLLQNAQTVAVPSTAAGPLPGPATATTR